MKAPVFCTLLLAALAALPAGSAVTGERPRAGWCAAPTTVVSRAVRDAHANASSFAPHARSRRHVYGVPIQRPIISHTRHKPRTAPPAR